MVQAMLALPIFAWALAIPMVRIVSPMA